MWEVTRGGGSCSNNHPNYQVYLRIKPSITAAEDCEQVFEVNALNGQCWRLIAPPLIPVDPGLTRSPVETYTYTAEGSMCEVAYWAVHLCVDTKRECYLSSKTTAVITSHRPLEPDIWVKVNGWVGCLAHHLPAPVMSE